MNKKDESGFELEDILKDAETIKSKVIKREKKEQIENIGRKVEKIKEHIDQRDDDKKVKKRKQRVEDIFSNTKSKEKLKVTDPLDVAYDEKTELNEGVSANNKNLESGKTDDKSYSGNKILAEEKSDNSYSDDEFLQDKVFGKSQSDSRPSADEDEEDLNELKRKNFKFFRNFNRLRIVRKIKTRLNEKKLDLEDEDVVAKRYHEYTCPNDIDIIKKEIKSSRRWELLRSIVLFLLMLTTVGSTLVFRFSGYFVDDMTKYISTYDYLNFFALLISIIICFPTIKNGVLGIARFKGNIDSSVAVAILACTIQSIFSIFNPMKFGESKDKISVFAGIAIIGLFLNSLGKLYKFLRVGANFKFVSRASQKYFVQMLDDEKVSSILSEDFKLKKPKIAFRRKTAFLKNFISLSFEKDLNDRFVYYVSPVLTLMSFVIALIVLFVKKDFFEGMSAFCLLLCVCVASGSFCNTNCLLYSASKKSLKKKAMICGYGAVNKFSKVNAVLIDQNDLFPDGTVNLVGLKTFSASRLDESILCAASVADKTGGPIRHIFSDVMEKKRSSIPKASDLKYEKGKGVVAWAKGKRIIIGNKEILEMYKIETPNEDFETPYRKKNYSVTYLAKGGELVAAFIISYYVDENIKSELQELDRCGIKVIVDSADPNIDSEFVSRKFGILSRNVDVVLSGDMDLNKFAKRDTSLAYIAVKDKVSSLFYALESCSKLKFNLISIVVLQIISILLGFTIISMISMYSFGMKSLNFLEILIYVSLWNLSEFVVSKVRRIS